MIRQTIIALAAIAALGLTVAASDAFAKGFNGPKGIGNGKGPGPTVHPKGPQNWGSPKFPKGPKGPQNWAGPKVATKATAITTTVTAIGATALPPSASSAQRRRTKIATASSPARAASRRCAPTRLAWA